MFLVAGATGHTGSVVAETLLAQGKKVRVYARDAKKVEALRARGAEVASGELGDDLALAAALRGVEGAYLLSPPIPTSNSVLAEQAVLVDRVGRAIEASGVPHVVWLSSFGAQHATGTGLIRTAHYAEQRLQRARAAITFVRAASFLENELGALATVNQGFVAGFTPRAFAFERIATADIGLVAARALVEGARSTNVIELGAPAPYSLDDLATTLSALTGKAVSPKEVPDEAIEPTMRSFGVSADMAALYREMMRGLREGLVTFEGKGARLVRGTTDLSTFFRQALAKAPAR
jgi:uncharacterized protein YbjT (DUF2867 family)